MRTITTIGLDIAKSVFQVHGVDAVGQVVIRRQLKRRYVLAFFQKLPTCLIGMEACASSHHWSRELQDGRLPIILAIATCNQPRATRPLPKGGLHNGVRPARRSRTRPDERASP
jgi:transposase